MIRFCFIHLDHSFSVVYMYLAERETPSLHLHYKDFLTTTSFSAIVPRISTFTLRLYLLGFFLYHRDDNFKRSILRAYVRFMSPLCRTPSNQYIFFFRFPLDLSWASWRIPVLMSFIHISTLSYGAYLLFISLTHT